MPEEAPTTLSEAQKFQALLHIQRALMREEHPTLRACGLTEDVAAALACESPPAQVVDLWIVADEGFVLDRCRVDKISDAGLGILARGELAKQPPLRVSVEHPPLPFWQRMRRTLLGGLWDVVKVALGVPVGILVGWFLWRHHWK